MRNLAAVIVFAVNFCALSSTSAQEPAPEQPEEVARAEALLAEFRAAEPDRGYGSERPTTSPARAGRSRVEVGRDMMKLGRSTVPLLLKALNDPDPQVSAVAALALGRIGDARAIEPMLVILQSFIPVVKSETEKAPPGNLRAAACVCALGHLREPRAIKPIMALMRLPVPLYSNLIRELGFQDDPAEYMCGIMSIVGEAAIKKIGLSAAPQFVRLLSDEDGKIRSKAARYLCHFGVYDRNTKLKRLEVPATTPEQAARLQQEREVLERQIQTSDRIAALAGEKLLGLLRDREPAVRASGAWALAALRGSSAVNPLIELLRDHEPEVREAAARALGALRAGAAVEPLTKLLNDGNRQVWFSVLSSLADIGDPAALDALASLLEGPGADYWSSVESVIARIGGPKALAILKSDLTSPDPKHRMAAALGLANAGTVNVVEPLLIATHDEQDDVRRAAFEALSLIADPRAFAVAMEALKDRDEMVRAYAVVAVGRINDPKSPELVKGALKDPSWRVRSYAVQALAQLKPPDLAECLQPLLKDNEESVRQAAKAWLNPPNKPAAGKTQDH